ncbi:MAG: hypothetical protein GY913_05915 [Proteobacteria bacterium]|nr:hypothetical protein [Pseudomonadota bacterium]MCP4916441.1 hypothetical protein [Pseudomonadota bacterium]
MLLLVLSLACRSKDFDADSGIVAGDSDVDPVVDMDGDGSPAEEDCDDANNTVYPHNGLDDDCDPTTLDDDLDEDGFGEADDCDDAAAEVNPDAVESCNGVDDDCNGQVDDAVGDLWFADVDEDGFGDPATETQSCDGVSGTVADDTDCDDTDETVFPGANEVCNEADDDCGGVVDEDV